METFGSCSCPDYHQHCLAQSRGMPAHMSMKGEHNIQSRGWWLSNPDKICVHELLGCSETAQQCLGDDSAPG